MSTANARLKVIVPIFSVCILVLLSACSKKGASNPDPIEVSVVAESIGLNLHPDRYIDDIFIVFNYNNARYDFTAR